MSAQMLLLEPSRRDDKQRDAAGEHDQRDRGCGVRASARPGERAGGHGRRRGRRRLLFDRGRRCSGAARGRRLGRARRGRRGGAGRRRGRRARGRRGGRRRRGRGARRGGARRARRRGLRRNGSALRELDGRHRDGLATEGQAEDNLVTRFTCGEADGRSLIRPRDRCRFGTDVEEELLFWVGTGDIDHRDAVGVAVDTLGVEGCLHRARRAVAGPEGTVDDRLADRDDVCVRTRLERQDVLREARTDTVDRDPDLGDREVECRVGTHVADDEFEKPCGLAFDLHALVRDGRVGRRGRGCRLRRRRGLAVLGSVVRPWVLVAGPRCGHDIDAVGNQHVATRRDGSDDLVVTVHDRCGLAFRVVEVPRAFSGARRLDVPRVAGLRGGERHDGDERHREKDDHSDHRGRASRGLSDGVHALSCACCPGVDCDALS